MDIRYQADLMWYRAVVEKANDETKTASVIFVDYGNREVSFHAFSLFLFVFVCLFVYFSNCHCD